MDPNRIDMTGLPTTLAIIGVAFLIVIALKSFNQKFPQVADRIKDTTPWMGWSEKEQQIIPIHRPTTRPSNRWL